jgi:hypothetical protein
MPMNSNYVEGLKKERDRLYKLLGPEAGARRLKQLLGEEKYQEFLKEADGLEITPIYNNPTTTNSTTSRSISIPPQATAAPSSNIKALSEELKRAEQERDRLVIADEKAQNAQKDAVQNLRNILHENYGPVEGEKLFQEQLKTKGILEPSRGTSSSVAPSKVRSSSAYPEPKRELIVDVGDQYDPETGVRIPPENVNLLNAQEVARRLANKPYEPNPHNKTAPLSNLEQGGYTVLNDLVQSGLNPEPVKKFRPPEGIGKEAFERYANPDYKFDRARTLKDRMIETVRENALKRLHDSFGDMDRQFAANRIGWNGRENILKAKMYENMNRELNQLDAETEMNLVKQQDTNLGNQGVLALRSDELEQKKALEAYRINKIEEESKRDERRKNALNAVSVGQNLRQANQEDINRKAQEFEREKKHHDTQYDTYLQRLRGATIGRPDLVLPERTQRTRPEFMSTMGPGEPMRMPLAGGQPILEQTPEPNSVLKDVAALATGAGGLYLKNKAINKLGKDISTE